MIDVNKIDWALLREQKEALLNSIQFFTHMQNSIYYTERARILEGLLNLIDYLQDSAVEAGIPETTVFGGGDEEEDG